jgi:hypothetical protein
VKLAFALALVAATCSGIACAGVIRCTAPDGSVTYQDSACPGGAKMQATDIQTDYPPPNDAERARILQREAELERRLEARREKEDQLAAMRMASAPASPPVPQEYDEVYPVYYPALGINRPHPRPPHRPHPAPRASNLPMR